MHRLFVALRPPKAIRGRLLGAMGGVPGARWQDDAQLHLTLRYIGEVEPHAAEDVALVLGSVRHAPVELRLDGCGVFDDSRGRPNAIWAGVSPREPLAALHRKVDAAIVRAGLEPERRAYLPHITLARMSGSAAPVDRWLAEHAALASEPFAIDAMVLYESRLGHGGASYEPVARYPLTGS
ncbi:RNA 2',3'-cyclic phosphodiesterase [Sphingomonas koreensis]|jgi:2'-5' RNA ligase|uniref:RNA 2',3'-cyclic phosphodiesterase n=1 Tax=Sphingomonas koreensis TaxID=93064 RepID=A0A1L6J5D1_9SPHN|nr:RNA 2',3'-cyclic phosphodiesterase [Sphingomonas koreensis]APR51171.1 2'-5' RNA ligase [Sphingomonas koreensis]MDC7810517.1 RNA 2',3'-cyclic phosphodiesterase [Sphingomonas koreensis]RSU17112.1 RNA 2',3'-cyclic phosphodiesterase [Sphingomonas koreensis]RSU20041.1 RNA 2',3'-cyclic phosphodiesterase [Sphingomonas koreensis]RSU22029.1 RNA 2',3'-cyclic phosphodiesterase [Sphingomonas koreensis]